MACSNDAVLARQALDQFSPELLLCLSRRLNVRGLTFCGGGDRRRSKLSSHARSVFETLPPRLSSTGQRQIWRNLVFAAVFTLGETPDHSRSLLYFLLDHHNDPKI